MLTGLTEEQQRTLLTTVLEIARTHNPDLKEVRGDDSLAGDLQIDSLDFAQVVATLELKLEIDPFASSAPVAKVNTVTDLLELYASAVRGTSGP